MSTYQYSNCPQCDARNGPGAPFCARCGKMLIRAGFAARPADDDEEEEPPRPFKKPAPDAVQKGAPPKKKPAPQPVDEDDEEEVRKPAKKVVRRDDDDEPEEEVRKPTKKVVRRDEDIEEEEVRKPAKKKPARSEEDADEEGVSARESTMLNVLAPVGGSLWGLASLVCGILGAVLPAVLLILYWLWDAKTTLGKLGYVGAGLAALLGLLALPLGLMSFIFRPKKGNYGGIASYMRAIAGMLTGLIGIVLAAVAAWYISTVVR